MRTILYALVALFFASCAATGSDPVQGYGVVAHATVVNDQGDPIADFRTNGVVSLVRATAAGTAGVRTTTIGAYVLGPLTFAEGFITALNRDLDLEVNLAPGDPLPAWVGGLFLPGEAEALGYTFGSLPEG